MTMKNEILLPYMDSGKKLENDNWVRLTFGNWYFKKTYLSIIIPLLIFAILCICVYIIVVLRQESKIIYIGLAFALLYGSFVSFIVGTCRKEVSIEFYNNKLFITYKITTLYGACSIKYVYKYSEVKIFLNSNRLYVKGSGERNIIFRSPDHEKKEEISKCNISHQIYLTGYMQDSVRKVLKVHII